MIPRVFGGLLFWYTTCISQCEVSNKVKQITYKLEFMGICITACSRCLRVNELHRTYPMWHISIPMWYFLGKISCEDKGHVIFAYGDLKKKTLISSDQYRKKTDNYTDACAVGLNWLSLMCLGQHHYWNYGSVRPLSSTAQYLEIN